MKYFFLLPFFCLACLNVINAQNTQNTQKKFSQFFEQANSFFSNHIKNGTINYEAIQKDSTLNYLIEQIATANIKQLDSIAQAAFIINAYNLNAIAEISKLLPLQSTVYETTFFSEILIHVAGEKYTFNQLKNERLALIATNPWFHFALIQAGLSFPMLADYAYTPNQLDKQLETQTTLVINHPDFLKINDKTITLPKFLKRYKKDIVGKNESILKLINLHYHFDSQNVKPIQFVRKIKYIGDKQWTLNYYLQATKSINTSALSKKQLKRKFNKFLPLALLRPGGIEIQLNNNLTNNSKINFTPNYQYRVNSLQSKFGINQTINIGFLVNYEFSAQQLEYKGLYSVGPQIWIKPFKEKENFTITGGFMLPLIKNINLYEWTPLPKTDGSSFYGKFNLHNAIGNKFLLDFSIGLSFENEYRQAAGYENLISIPINITLHYYFNKRFRIYSKLDFSPFKGDEISREIKGNTIYNQTGVSFTCSKKMEISFLYDIFQHKHISNNKDDVFTIYKKIEKWKDLNLNFRFSF